MAIPPAKGSAVAPAFLGNPPAPLRGFAAEEFHERRARLRASVGDGVVVLRGATEEEFSGANVYQQNSTFFYYTGVETPGAYLVLLPDTVPVRAGMRDVSADVKEILYLPARNAATETWTGPQWGPGVDAEKAAGIAKTADASSIWQHLAGWIPRAANVALPAPIGALAKTSAYTALMRDIVERAPAVQLRDISLTIARQRAVKSAAEVARIEAAIAITVEGQRAAREMILAGAGRWEYEVEACIYEAFRSRGAKLAFASIVGGGARGAVLHYERNDQPLEEGDLVVVDIGAQLDHYCGDLTRTYPVGGTCSARQREIYNLVQDAHERAIAGFRLGEDTLLDLTERCKAFLKDSPLRANNEKGEALTLDKFMPHGLSHHLGLDVHDTGDSMLPLQPGNVITVEPGLYLPGEGIGVRIEDDYLVTETGLQRLGPALATRLDELS